MEERQAYREKLEARLKEWNQRIETLRERSEEMGEEARSECRRRIGLLRQRQDELKTRLDQLRGSGDAAFKHLRSGVEKAMADLKSGLEDAYAAFRKQDGSLNKSEDGGESEVCLNTETPEHARLDNADMPCDDGRQGHEG